MIPKEMQHYYILRSPGTADHHVVGTLDQAKIYAGFTKKNMHECNKNDIDLPTLIDLTKHLGHLWNKNEDYKKFITLLLYNIRRNINN